MSPHNTILKTKAETTLTGCARRIKKTYELASAEQIEQGARWYREAGEVVDDIAERGGITRDTAAVVVAHLSPQTTWQRNVAAAYQVVTERRADGVIGRNVERALMALDADDPWSTFGPDARKTQRFARNILGDTELVTVDVWAMRVAFGKGWGPTWRTGEDDGLALTLGRVGVYEAVEAAYQRAARSLGVLPTTVQAATWIVARNGRAS